MENPNEFYLTDIPQEMDKHGLCKTLLVRNETIHLKHILTEIFVHKTIDISKYLDYLKYSWFDYMEYFTNRLRKMYKLDRNYRADINKVVKGSRSHFFPLIELHSGLDNVIVLDFDGVTTEKQFKDLYLLCVSRCTTYVCSANPTVTMEWFDKKELPRPVKLYACKGKRKKLNRLLELNKKHDFVFYVDNELEYLEYAWLFGIKTYLYSRGKILHHTLNSK